MRIPTASRNEVAHTRRAWGRFSAVLLSVVAALAVIVPATILFWPDGTDPEVRATLQFIGAGQQQTTNGITAISDSLAAERGDLKKLSDQFTALSARVSTLQEAMTRIQRDNAELAEQLKVTQTQMVQENVSVTEQLNGLTQMARSNVSAAEQLKESHEQIASALARVSVERLRPQVHLLQPSLPLPRPAPAVPKRKPPAPSQARVQQSRIQP